jgi:hypothetical protein
MIGLYNKIIKGLFLTKKLSFLLVYSNMPGSNLFGIRATYPIYSQKETNLMRKSTLFISAALTTFMLAVMFGVASAYQKIVQTGVPTTEAAQQTQPTDVVAGTSSPAAGTVTVDQAAALASSVIGRSDLYSAENTQLNGANAYLVTFSSGDLVYVSLDGKIMSISKLPVNYVLGKTNSSHGNSSGGNGGNNNSFSAPAPASVAPNTSPSTSPSTGGEDHSEPSHPGGDD